MKKYTMKNRTLYWILAAWITVLALSMLTGCKTKSVTEYVAVHDTTYSVTRDTVTKIKTEYSHDTLRIEVEKIVTLNEGGDTIRVALYRDRWRDRIVRQTDTVRVAKTDTIYKVAVQKHDKEVVKQPSFWQRWGVFLAVFAVCIVLTLSIKGKD